MDDILRRKCWGSRWRCMRWRGGAGENDGMIRLIKQAEETGNEKRRGG